MSELTRRDFLKIARDGFLYLSGALALGGLLRFLDYDPSPVSKSEFDLGNISNYPLNSRTLISEPPVLLLRTDDGFSAVSLVCTHLGCTLEVHSQGFTCPCHGSRFDPEGTVVQGPAGRSLQSLLVEVTEEGNLKLFTG